MTAQTITPEQYQALMAQLANAQKPTQIIPQKKKNKGLIRKLLTPITAPLNLAAKTATYGLRGAQAGVGLAYKTGAGALRGLRTAALFAADWYDAEQASRELAALEKEAEKNRMTPQAWATHLAYRDIINTLKAEEKAYEAFASAPA